MPNPQIETVETSVPSGPYLYFTREGVPVGPPIPAPPGANDLKVVWGPFGLVRAWWTRDCRPFGPPIPVPPGVNDVHLRNAQSDFARDPGSEFEPAPAFQAQPQRIDDILGLAAERVNAILEIVRPGVKLIDRDGQAEFQLELTSTAWLDLSRLEIEYVSAAYSRLNLAIRKGFIQLTPGFDSLKLANLEGGLNALAPGVFDAQVVAAGLVKTPMLLAAVSGQWFPPGIRIDLTKEQTEQLIAILNAGGALTAFLIALGVTAALAPLVAAALFLSAAAIRLAQTMSKNGTVGFKITGFPPIIFVVPFPT